MSRSEPAEAARPEATPDYTVIVPAYNEERYLGATLASLGRAMAAAPLSGELLVCDNNSTDSTAAVARAGGARVVFEGRNQIARARNTGARAARGRFLVFVDADTEVPPAVLAEALERLRAGDTAGGGAVVRMETGPSRVAAAMLAAWNGISRRRRLAAGSFVFVRREAFEAVGGFSERVYAGEEIWLSRAIKRWGRRHGLGFAILDLPVRSSGRKLEWYSGATVFGMGLLLLLFPALTLSRRLCWFWYRRPAGRS